MSRIQSFINYLANARFSNREALESILATMFLNPGSFLSDEGPSYEEISTNMAMDLTAVAGEVDPTINVTNQFNETDIPTNSIGYHRMFGPILADEDYWRWYFSTKRFIKDVKAVEVNPKFIGHFLHANTPGGEAWMLEKAHEVVKNCKKPFYEFTEKKNCSAGLFIGSPSKKRFSFTINDTHGSLGTMTAFMNLKPYFEKMGVQFVEENATRSDLKNKKFKNLVDGKPEQYIKEELDPLQEQFEQAVRNARPQLNNLKDDHPVFRGETFDATGALEIGLIDEITELEEAIIQLHNAGMKQTNKAQAHAQTLSYLQS
ncbi:S49 family peptidase [uncultured Draconibacterium sp.]|uniref:S49 family peptidase n=1 Tax=uncultured Draconibacterium sp. TaxID=1573823 RepID=UPI0029C7AF86|nr:S49 family peptidase [uncultured Draconibacterium sp.]